MSKPRRKHQCPAQLRIAKWSWIMCQKREGHEGLHENFRYWPEAYRWDEMDGQVWPRPETQEARP